MNKNFHQRIISDTILGFFWKKCLSRDEIMRKILIAESYMGCFGKRKIKDMDEEWREREKKNR